MALSTPGNAVVLIVDKPKKFKIFKKICIFSH